MALVALDGTPLVAIGQAGREGGLVLPSGQSTTQDAALESCQMIGQIFTEDGGSHTIDTTGSSSLGFRLASVTFANAGSSFKVGIATVDVATGPPGRATNSSDTITFSVSKTHTGGGGTLTANAWQENVPTAGSLAIANGNIVAFCTQMVTKAGADTVQTSTSQASVFPNFPFVTEFVGGAYAQRQATPNAVITFSDGILGFFYGSPIFATASTTQTWNNGSAAVEFGNFIQMPFPAKIYGILASCDIAGNTDFVLYSTPLGTPAAEKTASADLNVIGAAAFGRPGYFLFSSPYSSAANQPLAAIIKPTSVTNVNAPYVSFNAAAHQKSLALGVNGYAVSRASGAFAAVNSSKDRFCIGLLVGAFDNAVSTASGISRAHLGM